jgi:hypothetical protein
VAPDDGTFTLGPTTPVVKGHTLDVSIVGSYEPETGSQVLSPVYVCDAFTTTG